MLRACALLLASLSSASLSSASRLAEDFTSRKGSLLTSADLAGRVLHGRYQLLEQQGTGIADADSEAARPVKRPWTRFPWGLNPESPLSKEAYAEPAKLGKGAFGVAWKALDKKRNIEVAIKIFFYRGAYVTKERFKENPKIEKALDTAEEECKLVKRMFSEESSYPEGKAHICQCLESHVDMPSENDVPFIVMEKCGTSVKERLKEQWSAESPAPGFVEEVRRWIKGVLMATRFMSGLRTPLMHMDIHWANVVITDENEAKLIDFGLTQRCETDFPDLQHTRSPPEHVWTEGGDMKTYPCTKAWAYDTWTIGALYSELLCAEQNYPFQTSFALLQFREGQSMHECKDKTPGIGSPEDWAVIEGAVTPFDARKSPEELMALMP